MCGQSKAIRRRLRLQEEQLFGVPWIYTTNSGSGRWPKPPHAWGGGGCGVLLGPHVPRMGLSQGELLS